MAAAILALVASGGSAEPVKVIFDTDMIGDYDDVGALACLHALADAGECEILATLSCTRGNASVAAIEVINAWYGRPDIPVGCAKGIGVSGPSVHDQDPHGHDKFLMLRDRYPSWVRHADSDDAPDALDVCRRVLSSQPDHSVTICSVGFLTNLRRLVEAEPELVAKKVKLWVAMACKYPKGHEFNAKYDAESSAVALAKWPTPIAFSDFDYGKNVYTGRRLSEDERAEGPVKDVFARSLTPRHRCTDRSWDRVAGHPSWDETAVLYAVRGAGDVFGVERGSHRMTGKDGSNAWTADPLGRDLRLVEKLPYAEVGRIIDELMCRQPKRMAVWDFDGTILDGDCTEGLVRDGKTVYEGLLADCIVAGFARDYKGKDGVARFRHDYEAKIAAGHKLEAYADCARIFAGADVKEIEAFCRKRFGETLARHLYDYSLRRFRELESTGVENHVVSASADFFVQAAAGTLGVPRERIHGILVEIKDGKLTDRIIGPFPYGEGKTKVLRALEKKSGGTVRYGFGNSYSTDGPFLKAIVRQGGTSMMFNGGKTVKGMTELFVCTNLVPTVGAAR